MKLYLNCDKNSELAFTKADYLLLAAKKLGKDVVRYEGGEVENVLNIEPFTKFIKGTKWTGIWEIDILCDRREMSPSNWIASDSVFIAINTLPDRLESFRERTTLLFQACEPSIHKRIPDITQAYDFVFSGSVGLQIYEERERAMELLRQKFTFKDYGKGHSPSDYIKDLNTAKVQFIRSMKTPIGNGELAQRFFECLAIGPVLTNYVDDLKHTGLVEGEDYMSYKNDKQMMEKMALLLRDADLANRLAESGRKKALLYHTYEHRLVTILKEVEKNG